MKITEDTYIYSTIATKEQITNSNITALAVLCINKPQKNKTQMINNKSTQE